MSTINTLSLLYGLKPFLQLAAGIAQQIESVADGELVYYVSLSYDTIDIKLEKIDVGIKRTWVQCTFEIKGTVVVLTNVSTESPEKEMATKNFIEAQSSDGHFPWNTEGRVSVLPPEIERYLTIADAIAKEVYLFDSGDNYRPGYFTEIIEAQDHIKLTQINRRNARSSDHKDDYVMRNLEFLIPITSDTTNSVSSTDKDYETIGKMQVRLSDRSSKQNRQGGDRIRNKISESKSDFQ